MTTDQKKYLRKLFQSFLDAVVDLLQTEHGVIDCQFSFVFIFAGIGPLMYVLLRYMY